MSLLDFDTLTFDCYGTLIDWETGILEALRATMPQAAHPQDEVLETFARFEAEEEEAHPALPYPQILARVHQRLAAAWDLEDSERQAASFGASVGNWPAFADSAAALEILERHFRLVVLSNVDKASFRASEKRLGVEFDFVFTAEEIGSYKPSPKNFEHMLAKLEAEGIPKSHVLHTAQSLFHDHLPASRLGLATCWIDRRHGKEGWGATPEPEEEVKVDYRFTSLAEMAAAVEAEAAAWSEEVTTGDGGGLP